jgi:cation diffusion facilitator family transporter
MSFQTARPYTYLSIAAAIMTIALKTGAYFLTGSVGLLSDALESVINLVAALAAFWALSFAQTPADEDHPFGHNKAEYFSSGLESVLIIITAVGIVMVAWPKLFDPQPIEQINLGLLLSLIATVINGGVAWTLLRAGRRLRSITLRTDAHHLLTDRDYGRDFCSQIDRLVDSRSLNRATCCGKHSILRDTDAARDRCGTARYIITQ